MSKVTFTDTKYMFEKNVYTYFQRQVQRIACKEGVS